MTLIQTKSFIGLNNLNVQPKKESDCVGKPIIKQISFNDLPDLKNYCLPFLGKKNYSPNEREFLNFRKTFSTKLHRLRREYQLANWNFATNSTEENYKSLNNAYGNLNNLFMNKEKLTILKDFQEKGINDPTLKKHLKELISSFENTINNHAELKALSEKQNEISQKTNNYRPKLNGRECSETELRSMLKTEKDLAKRKQIYKALNSSGDLIAQDIVQLAKLRNQYAQKKGYEDYFSYASSANYGINEKEMFSLLDSLAKETETIYAKQSKSFEVKLAKAFKIDVDDIEYYHYGLKLNDNPYKALDEFIKSRDDLLPLSQALYKSMGWDLKSFPIEYDIFPRKSKLQHGFCSNIDAPNDVRVILNLAADMYGLETLNHDTGHAVYYLGISDHIPYLDRDHASYAMTEAIAMLIETLPLRETEFLNENLNIPEKLLKTLDTNRKEGLVNFVRTYLKYIHFEKELYKNPDQDLAKLWYDLGNKYELNPIPDKLDNEWATIPHFLTHPAYLQNYLKAEIIAAQIHKTIVEKFGKMSNNPETEHFLRTKLFSQGCKYNEAEAIKRLTGSELKVDAFLDQIKNL